MNIQSDQTTGALVRLLDATALRHRVLSNNLANSDTPGYVRQEVSFENDLAEAVQRGEPQTFEPNISEDRTAAPRGDGNNVTLERELAELNKNALTQQMAIQLLQTKLAMQRMAITGKSA